jgi:hypothetical protein
LPGLIVPNLVHGLLPQPLPLNTNPGAEYSLVINV